MIVTVARRPWLSATKRVASPTRTLACEAEAGKAGRIRVTLLGEIVEFDKDGQPTCELFRDWEVAKP